MSHNPPELDAATAMMLAADLLEKPGRFNYWEYKAEYCDTRGGCPGAWIAYVGGLKDANAAFEWLGVDSLSKFASAMNRVGAQGWTRNPTLAATGLRRLAQERMS